MTRRDGTRSADGYAHVRVVSGDCNRVFYGVRELVRPGKKSRVSLSQVAEEGRSEWLSRSANLAGFFTEEMDEDGFEIVEFIHEEGLDEATPVDYFLVRQIDGAWSVVVYVGHVYVCNESGETVDAFHSGKAGKAR